MVRRIRVSIWLSVVAVFALSAAPASAPPSEGVRLTILHTNDVHGRLLPFTYTESGRGAIERDGVGGAARRATVIRRLQRETTWPTVLVDAGDTFTRGALTNAYEGLADVAAMNSVGYHMAAVGNNEFKARDAIDKDDWRGSQAALLRVVRASRFPWLCANLTDGSGARLPGIRPYLVKRIAGIRIGFLGLTAPRSAKYPQTRGWKITDPIEAARIWVPRVRRECDVLIALTHIGSEADQELAAAVDGIDAVVGGDSHTFLYEPVWTTSPSGRRTPIAQAGEYGVNVGRLDLRFERVEGRYRLAEAHGELVPVTAETAEAVDVKRALARFVRPFLRELGQMPSLGSTTAEKRLATTQLVVRAIRAATGADIAMNPNGAGLVDLLHRATVTKYDLYAALPFRNRAVVAMLSGAEIRRVTASDATTVLDGDVAHLDDARTYRVAMMDYVAPSYGVSSVRILEQGPDIRTAVASYLAAASKSHVREAPGLRFARPVQGLSGAMHPGPSCDGLLTYRDTGYASI